MTSDIPELDILVDEFVTESGECLGMAVDDVLSLERKPDPEAIDRIFRVAHTIKGTAGMLNFNTLSEFVHSFEDICSDIRSGDRKVDKQVADGLLKCLDFIQLRLDVISDTRQDEGDCSWGEEILRSLQGGTVHEALGVVEPVPVDPASIVYGLDEFFRLYGNGQVGKALIVEDDFAVRSMLYSFLSRFMDCYVARDGGEAIQAVTESYVHPNSEPFSLIVMGVVLPIIDGLRATRAVRALERAKGAGFNHPGARICMIASVDEYETMRDGIQECGADSHMIKPLDFGKLMRVLVQHQLIPDASGQELFPEERCA